jgi:uncharacterized repeat protein (TIGR01451 family)
MLGRRAAFPFVFLATFASLFISVPTAAALPTGYQEYYVLGYEEHIWRAFEGIYGGTVSANICSTVSLVATANHQVVYYDHWEDGYEANLLHPIQSSTEIYSLSIGASLSLTSTQASGPAINQYVPVASGRDPADIRYDGGDRIITSGGPVALTHAMWPYNSSWIGGGWVVYSREAYAGAYSYRLPIGEDLYDYGGGDTGIYGDFRRVYLQLVAFEDNTTISIDNGAGGVVNLTLNQGQTYSSMGYIDSTSAPSTTLNAGTSIRSNKPTQMGLVTGADSNPGFQGRFLTVLPDRLWGSDYVVPVPSGDPGNEAEVYISNPNDFPITVHAYDATTETTFSISPTRYISATVPYSQLRGGSYVPADSAVRFTSSDGTLGVVVCADTSSTSYDWGFSGVPAKHLTYDYYVSWAPGSYNSPPTENGSPVWVTPLASDTTFYVDFSPLDGIADQTFTLDVLEQRRIFDPDNDNTGMHVWATGKFAAAWGEDSRTADTGNPYLDLGAATLPLHQRWLDPILTLDKTAEPTILPPAGGTVTFTLVTQAHDKSLVEVNLTDTLPISWTYVPGSTQVTYPDDTTGSPEPTVNGQTLYWDLPSPLADLGPNQGLTLTFQARITTSGSVGVTAYDDFESATYSHGQNWTGDWQEGGDDGSPDSGDVTITDTHAFAGNHSLHVQGSDNSITRTLDLSDFTSPVLRLMRQLDSLEGGESFYVDIYDGIRWTTVLTWTDQDRQASYLQETVNLTSHASPDTAIRFRSNTSGVDTEDHLYVDRVEIYDAVATNFNRGEAIGKYEYSDTLFNPSDEATVYIGPLDLAKSVSSAEAEIGDTLVYTLSYANVSPSAIIPDVVLRDVIPVQYVTLQSASGGYSYDPASGTITWTVGTLGPGDSSIETFTVRVNDFVEDGTLIENVGYVSGDQAGSVASNVARTTVLAPNIEFTKSGPTVAAPGQAITYILYYRGIGGAPATGVTIQDTLPTSTTYASGSLAIRAGTEWVALSDAAGDDQGTYISPTLIITPGVTPGIILPDEEGWIRYSARLNDTLSSGSLILNSATLDRDLDIPRESNLAVTRIADLLINKTAEQTVVGPGGVISYTLSYRNDSTTTTQTEVYVREPIPDYTSFVPGTGVGGDRVEYSWDNGTSWTTTLPITPVTHIRWYDAELPTDTLATVSFAVQANAVLPEGTVIRNLAHISSTETAAYLDEWIPSNQVEVATASSNFVTVYGTVFRDADGDGEQGAGESGIPDVRVTLDENGYTTTTELDGSYTLSTTVAGKHVVVETDPTISFPPTRLADLPGYFSTTPNEVHVDVPLGSSHRVDFGDMLTNAGFSSIHGTTFEDVDGDGRHDVDELGIPDATVTITFPNNGEAITTTTDLNGTYALSTTVAGVHIVSVGQVSVSAATCCTARYSTTPAFPTTPDPVHVETALGNGYPVDFGEASVGAGFASIYGTVFNDIDGDQEQDGSEVGIAGVTMTLDTAPGGTARCDDVHPCPTTVSTGPYGGYTFSTLAPGPHVVLETDPNGYTSTTSNEAHLDVSLGSSYQRNFGDVATETFTCAADFYEENDTATQAGKFVVGTSQAHQFCDDTTDWTKFSAEADGVYTVTAYAWGQRCDTLLTLLDTDGHTQLAENDDYEGATDHSSRIVWQAPVHGVYYVHTTSQAGVTGYQTEYDLVIEGPTPPPVYLPILARK